MLDKDDGSLSPVLFTPASTKNKKQHQQGFKFLKFYNSLVISSKPTVTCYFTIKQYFENMNSSCKHCFFFINNYKLLLIKPYFKNIYSVL